MLPPTLLQDLLEAFAETMIASVLFVGLFSLGVRTLGKNTAAAEGEKEVVSGSEAGAVLCFVLCFVIVAFGIYLAATK